MYVNNLLVAQQGQLRFPQGCGGPQAALEYAFADRASH